MNEIENYVLGLSLPVTPDQLKNLIGKELNAVATTFEWKKKVVSVDRVEVERIECHLDVGSNTTIKSMIFIWCDFFLDGRKKYHAHLGLEKLQQMIRDAAKPLTQG